MGGIEMKNALHILNICLLAIILYLYYLKINVGENIWIPGILLIIGVIFNWILFYRLINKKRKEEK